MRLKNGMRCEVDNCPSTASEIVYSRQRMKVIACCKSHGDLVIDEDGPEYHHICENCGCRLPIN